MLVKMGDTGENVKKIQEWLCYNKISVSIDSSFGPATREGVRKYQAFKEIPVTGVVDVAVWSLLSYPITFLSTIPPNSRFVTTTLKQAIVDNALRHYLVKPIEIGGDNRGPFVRYYMKGNEGPAYPWCAGCVSIIVLQAFDFMGISPAGKFAYQMSCDFMYADAKKFGTLIQVPVPGCIFLSYNSSNPSDCVHAGIVTAVDLNNGIISTMEGNGLPLKTPVLTPSGWATIGSLRVGDLVIDPEGQSSKVTGVFPQGIRPVFKIDFRDGNSIVADSSHRWKVYCGRKSFKKTEILTTEELMLGLQKGRKYFLPSICPVNFEKKVDDLLLDPYLLGVLLGVGVLLGDRGLTRIINSSSLRLTSKDDKILKKVENMLPENCELKRLAGYYHITGSGIFSILRELGLAGLRSEDKYIPECYKWSSVQNRISLFQGLMDSDGSIDKVGRMEFATSSHQLAKDIQFIIQSLGGKASISDSYILRNIRFLKDGNIVPFQLDRKLSRLRNLKKEWGRWGIKSVEYVGEEETVCISVSASSKLYLIENFIPTHNTNDSGSREGYEYIPRIRSLTNKYYIKVWK